MWVPLAVASLTLASVVLIPGNAHAMPHPSDADFGFTYNPDTQQIGFWFAEDDNQDACVWTGSPTVEPDSDVDEPSGTQCFVVDVVGPNSQVNHGTIVSSFVHGLKDLAEISGYDGPRGEFISAVAKGDDGKKKSTGSKNKGTGGSDTVGDDAVEDGNGNSGGKGNGNGNSGGNGNGNAKGKGIGKDG
jgi:hypothetical protein